MVLAAQAHNNRKKRQQQKASKPNVLEAKTENQKNYIKHQDKILKAKTKCAHEVKSSSVCP